MSALLLVALTAVSGCKKSKPCAPAATAPPRRRSLHRNTDRDADRDFGWRQVQLAWRTTDATSVTIDGIGDVLRWREDGDSGRVDHLSPCGARRGRLGRRFSACDRQSAPAIETPATTMTDEQMFKASVQDIFFDYDNYDIRTDSQSTLAKDADFLVKHPTSRS